MENTFSTGMDCVPKNLMLDRSILGKPPSDTLAHQGGSPHAGMGMVSRMRWHGILWTVVALSVLVGAGVVLSEPLICRPRKSADSAGGAPLSRLVQVGGYAYRGKPNPYKKLPEVASSAIRDRPSEKSAP